MEIPKVRQVVPVTVTGHLPGGLRVELPGGGWGKIRVREVSWDAAVRASWRQHFPVGWKSEALVLKQDGPQLELSLRLAQADPWEEIDRRLCDSKSMRGVVTSARQYGAFVEVAGGLTGLLHQSALPAWEKQPPPDLFWPGDYVCVKTKKIDKKERQISFVCAPVDSLPPGASPQLEPSSPESARSSPFTGSFEQLAREAVRHHILIIANDDELARAEQAWLEYLNQRVERVASVEDGLKRIEKEPPDLALIDQHLPDAGGVAAVRLIRSRWPALRCALAVDWARLENSPAEVEALRAERVDLLAQPIEPEELLELLAKQKEPEAKVESPAQLRSEEERPPYDPSRSGLAPVQALVEGCRQTTEFDAAVLFSFDTVKRTVQVVAACGKLPELPPSLDDLVYSPVRDAAEDGRLVRIEDSRGRAGYASAHYLIQAFPFCTLLGVQAPCALPTRYALFLFDSAPREIFQDEINYARAAALVIGNSLEKQALLQQVAAVLRNTFVERRANTLVHEINHNLGIIQNVLGPFSQGISAWSAGRRLEEGEISVARRDLGRIQQAVNKIVELTENFRRPAMPGAYQLVRLDELAQETRQMLSGESSTYNVPIQIISGEELLVTRSRTSLLQQVLINLLLNAMQQIHRQRGSAGGRVCLRIEKMNKTLRLLVCDDGPGIHHAWWERIFEPGFTTREEGSGLGLYISRSIIESMGGRIYVAESYILGGTTIAVELPLKL